MKTFELLQLHIMTSQARTPQPPAPKIRTWQSGISTPHPQQRIQIKNHALQVLVLVLENRNLYESIITTMYIILYILTNATSITKMYGLLAVVVTTFSQFKLCYIVYLVKIKPIVSA